MKKIYTFLLWMVLVAVCVPAASAKTLTITIDNPDAASYRNPLSNYDLGEWDEQNSFVLEYGDEEISVPIVANDGYELTGAAINGETFISRATSSFNISTYGLEGDDVVTITTQVKEPKTITVIGDPAKIKVRDDNYVTHDATDNVDGAWNLECTSDWGEVYFTSLDGYFITSISDDKGNDYVTTPTNYYYLSESNLPSGKTVVTVEAKSEEEIYDGYVTVNVDGAPYMVSFRFDGQYNGVSLNEGTNTVRFDSSTALPFTIQHGYNSDYNPQSLYSVKLNGVELEAVNRVYTIESVNNGDVFDIAVNPPATEINVSVTFADEFSKGALSSLYYDSNLVAPDEYDSFSAQTGKSLSFNFDYQNYNITMTENGNPVYISYGSYSHTLANTEGYNYVITATEIKPYKVTVICENYEHLRLSNNWDGSAPYELTGVESVISVLPDKKYTYIKADEGWYVVSASNAETGQSYSSSFYAEDGLTLFVELAEFKRDKSVTLYTEPTSWNYLTFTLNSNNYDLRLQITPEPGYSTIYYNDSDRPFSVSGYTSDYGYPQVFLNGVFCENSYGYLPALEDVQPGDVIKIMSPDAPLHDVTYNVSAEAAVKVVHDLTQEVDYSAAHQVHTGTEIHVIPVGRDGAGIKVFAGETELAADDEGKFVHTVTEPVEIKVTPAVPTSIIDIEATAESTAIYNLQGVKVRSAASATEIQSLPAGVYITSTGKKIIVK